MHLILGNYVFLLQKEHLYSVAASNKNLCVRTTVMETVVKLLLSLRLFYCLIKRHPRITSV